MGNDTEKSTLDEKTAEDMIKAAIGGNYPKRGPTLGGGVAVASTSQPPVSKPSDEEELPVIVQTLAGERRGTGIFKDLATVPENERVSTVASPQLIEVEHNAQHADEDAENNYRQELCPHCLLYELVGCDHCGIFQYAWKRNEFKIKVTKQ